MTDISEVDIQNSSQFAIVSEDVLLPSDNKKRVATTATDDVNLTKEEIVEQDSTSEDDEKRLKTANNESEAVPNPSVSKTEEDANAEKGDNEDLPADEDIKQPPLPSELQQQNVSSEEKENFNENEDENEVENGDKDEDENENEIEVEVENGVKVDEKPVITRTKIHSGILKKKSRWLRTWRDRELVMYETSDGRYFLETYVPLNHQKVEDSKEDEEKLLANKEIIDDSNNDDEQNTDTEEMSVSVNGNKEVVRRPTDRIELDVYSIESQVEKISFHVAKCDEGFVIAIWEMSNGQRKKEFQFRTESKRERDQWFNILINISENGSGCASVESETQSETLLKDTLNVLLITLRKVEGMRMLSLVDGKNVGYYSTVVVENEKNMKILEECEKKLGNVAVGMNEILEIQRKLKEIAERDDGQMVHEMHLKVEEEQNNQ